MIIKNLSINQNSKYRIKQLVRYVLLDNDETKNPFDDFVILQNIHSIDPATIHKSFLAQDKYRKQRKNGICYHHSILSFSPLDRPHITKNILEDLAKQFIRIRGAEEALVLCKHHEEKAHVHLHFLISATKYKSNESLRLDNTAYKAVQEDLEHYQQATYPQLKHSLAYINKVRKNRTKQQADRATRQRNEFQMKARLEGKHKQPSKKEMLKARVSELLKASKTPKDFLSAIQAESDFELYEYRNKITGLSFEGKKYRFTTFGIKKEDLQVLQNQQPFPRQRRKSVGQTRGLHRGS